MNKYVDLPSRIIDLIIKDQNILNSFKEAIKNDGKNNKANAKNRRH